MFNGMLFMDVAKGVARNIYATQSSCNVFASVLHDALVRCAVRFLGEREREHFL